jgi:hypothetical protein
MDEPSDAAVNASPALARPGPLTRKVVDYVQTMERLVPAVSSPADWAPLADLVAVQDFERLGTFLEVQHWQQYTEMLTCWATATTKFEVNVRRISEVAPLVYFEVEERHIRGDMTDVVNSMTVFEFNEADRIRRLDVYLQQRR